MLSSTPPAAGSSLGERKRVLAARDDELQICIYREPPLLESVPCRVTAGQPQSLPAVNKEGNSSAPACQSSEEEFKVKMDSNTNQ